MPHLYSFSESVATVGAETASCDRGQGPALSTRLQRSAIVGSAAGLAWAHCTAQLEKLQHYDISYWVLIQKAQLFTGVYM